MTGPELTPAERRGVERAAEAFSAAVRERRFEDRHRERYARVLRREQPLAEALAENDRDWHELIGTGAGGRGIFTVSTADAGGELTLEAFERAVAAARRDLGASPMPPATPIVVGFDAGRRPDATALLGLRVLEAEVLEDGTEYVRHEVIRP